MAQTPQAHWTTGDYLVNTSERHCSDSDNFLFRDRHTLAAQRGEVNRSWSRGVLWCASDVKQRGQSPSQGGQRRQRVRVKRGPMTGSAPCPCGAIFNTFFRVGFAALSPPHEESHERKKRRKRNAGRRNVQLPHQAGAAPATERRLAPPSACGRARLPAFHHGTCRDDRTPRLSSSPRVLGRN